GGSAIFHNAASVVAFESGNRAETGSALAKGDIHSKTGAITFADGVSIQANARGGSGAGNLEGMASLAGIAGGILNLDKTVTVNAHAVSSGTKAVIALAQGKLQGSAVNGQGNIAFSASALGMGHNIDDAIAVAGFSADAARGGILLQNNIL